MRTRIIGIVVAVALAIGGAVVLTGYVNGADVRALAGAQPVRVYVAEAEIPARTPANQLQRYISAKDIPRAAAVDGRVTSLADLTGLVTNSVIERGEQLLAGRLSAPANLTTPGTVAIPKNLQTVSIKLPLEQAVSGTLKAGDLVGVVVADGGDFGSGLAKLKLHKVLVAGVHAGDSIVDRSSAGAQPVTQQIITLALSGDDTTTLVWGQKYGTVWLTLEQTTSDDGSGKTVRRGSCGTTCTTVHP
jgi:pilus assembly protein CpaB